MGAMTAEAAALRGEFEKAVLKEMARTGADKFQGDAVVKAFSGRVARTTAYRWLRETIASGKPGQAITRKVKRAAAARAKRTPDPAAAAAAEIVERLPVRASPSELLGNKTIPVLDKLRQCMATADELMAYARTPEGLVRNSGLLLKASEHLRRTVESATRLYEALRQVDQVDRLHDIILDEIGKLSPERAEAIVVRLGQVATEWGG